MNNSSIEARVVQCFSNVFPDLTPDRIRSASTETLETWDSVAHITLLSAISEEFGTAFEPEDYMELTSYALLVDSLKARTTGGLS